MGGCLSAWHVRGLLQPLSSELRIMETIVSALPLQAHSYARRCGFKDCTIAFIIMENHRNLIAHMFADGPHAARLLRAVGTPAAMAASLSAGASTQLFASSDPLPLKRKAVGDWIREDTYAVADDA